MGSVLALTLGGRFLGFLFPAIVLRELGSDAAGLAYFFINTAFFVVQPISGGAAMALVRPVAARASAADGHQWTRAALAVGLPAIGLALVVGVIFCLTADAPLAPMLVMVFGLSADALYAQILNAYRRYEAAAAYRLVANVAQLIALAAALSMGIRSVLAVVSIFSGSYLVGIAASELHAGVLGPVLRRPADFTRAQSRTILVSALPTTLAGFAYAGLTGADTYLVRYIARDSVAAYGAAKALAAPMLLIGLAVTMIVQPEAATVTAEAASRMRRRLIRSGLTFAVLASLGAWLLAAPVVSLVYSDRYVHAASCLRWLAVGTAALGLTTLLSGWCNGRGLYRLPFVSLAAGACSAIGLDVVLIGPHGIVGAGLAMCAGSAVALVVLIALSGRASTAAVDHT